jgi:hypothetical protein
MHKSWFGVIPKVLRLYKNRKETMASKLRCCLLASGSNHDPSHVGVPSRSQAFLTIHSIYHILLLLTQKARK